MGHITTETISGCPREACNTAFCDIANVAFRNSQVDVSIFDEAGLEVKRPFAGMPDDRYVNICSGMIVTGTVTAEALGKAGLLIEAEQQVGTYPVRD